MIWLLITLLSFVALQLVMGIYPYSQAMVAGCAGEFIEEIKSDTLVF